MVALAMRKECRFTLRNWGTGPTLLAVFMLLLCPHATEGGTPGYPPEFLDSGCASSESGHEDHDESHHCVFDHAHSHHFRPHSNQEISCKPDCRKTYVIRTIAKNEMIAGTYANLPRGILILPDSLPFENGPLLVVLRL